MKKAFTLIELLIVVAIIAILAAIAVPNFLEAQTRAKTSRAKSDMRTAATGLEAYNVDYNAFPPDGYNFDAAHNPMNGQQQSEYNYWFLPHQISTPTAYLTTANITDPFRQVLADATHWQYKDVRYTNQESTWGTKWDYMQGINPPVASTYYGRTAELFGGWRMLCVGPDRTQNPVIAVDGTGDQWIVPGVTTPAAGGYPASALPAPYDATNGTASRGDITRTQKSSTGYTNTAG